MKRTIIHLIPFCFLLSASAQNYLGVFEQGETVPFLVAAAEAETGAPTNPVDLKFQILLSGETIHSGPMFTASLGIATGAYNTSGDEAGNYNILISGLIGDVTAQTYKTYSLVPSGLGIASIAPAISSEIADSREEMKISTREMSRARLWYAQYAINSATRKVPVDMPSHMEIQIAAPDDIHFVTPLETFYKVYCFPNSATSTISSREIRSVTAPTDGVFYLSPDISW